MPTYKCNFKKLALTAAVGIAAMTAASSASAVGFLLTEHSAVAMGRAYAGAGVVGDDLSAVFFNPAGMTLLSGTRAQVGGTFFSLDLKYKGFDGEKENGRGSPSVTPEMYFTHQFNDQLYVGLGITTPDGMKTDYDKDWGGSGRGIGASFSSFDFNPSVAWKFNDLLSVGAGMSIRYAHAKLSNGLGAFGVQGLSGTFKYKGSDWNLGYDVGIMLSPSEKLRFGLSYRSGTHMRFKGHYSINATMYGFLNMDETGYGYGKFNEADTILFSGTWETTERLRTSFIARWANWSHYDQMHLIAKDPGTLLSMVGGKVDIDNYWRASWLVTLGFDYKFAECFTGRFGFGIETRPIKEDKYRTALIPDANRLFLAVGASWVPYNNWTVDLGIAHHNSIGSHRNFYANQEGEATGKFSLSAWIVALQMQYKF